MVLPEVSLGGGTGLVLDASSHTAALRSRGSSGNRFADLVGVGLSTARERADSSARVIGIPHQQPWRGTKPGMLTETTPVVGEAVRFYFPPAAALGFRHWSCKSSRREQRAVVVVPGRRASYLALARISHSLKVHFLDGYYRTSCVGALAPAFASFE